LIELGLRNQPDESNQKTGSCLNESGEDLLRRANEALYLAKRTGKNQVVLAKAEKSLSKSLVRIARARAK